MNNEFFKEQLRIAELKADEERKIKDQIKQSKTELLKEFSKPVIDFLFFIHENYTFNRNSDYKSDKKLVGYNFTKEYFLERLENTHYRIDIPICGFYTDDGYVDYIEIRIDDNMNCCIVYSKNTTQDIKIFNGLQSFVTDFSLVIAKNRDI